MTHPQIVSAGLFERNGRVLAVHRRKRPLAGQWLLPLTLVSPAETAEGAVKRHAREQFGVDVSGEAFADTVYIDDPADKQQYVANIFRAQFAEGPLRFRADGDYDDARWLEASELALVWMPPPLRDSTVRLLNEPSESPELNWTDADGATADERTDPATSVGAGLALPATDAPPEGADVPQAPSPEPQSSLAPAAAAGIATQSQPAEAVPLAERALADVEPPAQVDEPPADNRAGWNAISKAYQDAYDDYLGAALMWSWTVSEDDVHLLEDVRGKHVIVLGCGGGQDVIALCEMGAVATGIDQSDEQIAFARKLAVKRGADNASFAVGSVEDLSRFDDESFDAAVAAHMLNYVERIDDTLRETARVLRPASVFALSVRHPFDAIVAKDAPFGLERAYWETRHDWTWDFDSGASGAFTQWLWTIEQWFEMLGAAGFAVERVLELREELPDTRHDHAARSRMIPYTLAIKARKR